MLHNTNMKKKKVKISIFRERERKKGFRNYSMLTVSSMKKAIIFGGIREIVLKLFTLLDRVLLTVKFANYP